MRLFLLTIGAPLVIVLLAIPLVLQRIPPNLFYGFRTRTTLADDRVWYAANRISGITLGLAGLLWLVTGVVMMQLGPDERVRPVTLGIGLAGLGVAVIISFVFLRRISGRWF